MVKLRISTTWSIIAVGVIALCTLAASQETSLNEVFKRISKGSEEFSLELFERLSNTLPTYNLIISPISVWSLLLLLTEGASGNTLREMQLALHINEDLEFIRQNFKYIQEALNVNTSTIELSQVQGLFYPMTKPLYRQYTETVSSAYKTGLIPIDFNNVPGSVEQINDFGRRATGNQIRTIVSEQDVQDAALILASAIYFRGEWKIPFNDTLTKQELFYDEDEKVIGFVNMMSQTDNYLFIFNRQLGAFLLEIPYGKQDRLSMIILLPQKGIKLTTVIKSLHSQGVKFVLDTLRSSNEEFGEMEIEVKLPKFSYASDLRLNTILSEMGIKDLFSAHSANLQKMSNEALYLSRCVHKARITVNEKGTIAAAVSTGTIMYKQQPQKFNIDRPFAYLIVDKVTNSVLFCGQVNNPVKKDFEEKENKSSFQRLNIAAMCLCTGFIALLMSYT